MKVCKKCEFEFQEPLKDDNGNYFIGSHYCINNTYYCADEDKYYDATYELKELGYL